MLGTTQTLVSSASEQYCYVRTVIDTGSQILVTARLLANGFGLRLHRPLYQIIGISSEKAHVLGTTQWNIASRFTRHPVVPINPVALNTIVERLLLSALPPHDQCTPLDDENYAIPSSIDMLLSADVYLYILRDPSNAFRVDQLFTLNTIFEFALMAQFLGQIRRCLVEHFSPSFHI